jgi:hypothetical protein
MVSYRAMNYFRGMKAADLVGLILLKCCFAKYPDIFFVFIFDLMQYIIFSICLISHL